MLRMSDKEYVDALINLASLFFEMDKYYGDEWDWKPQLVATVNALIEIVNVNLETEEDNDD
jgi:hypothetical protein